MTQDARTIALNAFHAIFRDFDAEATAQGLAPDYIQHNPGVPTGAAPIIGFVPKLKESGIQATVHRVIANDDHVVLHVTYDNAQLFGGDTLVTFDVFRVQDGRVAEHWDNLQPLQPRNPSGRTMTDGATAITDRAATAANEKLVRNFVDVVLRGGDGSRMTEFVSEAQYIQHNPGIGDGLSGLGAALEAMAKQGITMVYEKTHLVVAEGNFVFTASEGQFAGKPTAFFDLFRVDGGQLVEQWDTTEKIAPRSEWKNNNGKF